MVAPKSLYNFNEVSAITIDVLKPYIKRWARLIAPRCKDQRGSIFSRLGINSQLWNISRSEANFEFSFEPDLIIYQRVFHDFLHSIQKSYIENSGGGGNFLNTSAFQHLVNVHFSLSKTRPYTEIEGALWIRTFVALVRSHGQSASGEKGCRRSHPSRRI